MKESQYFEVAHHKKKKTPSHHCHPYSLATPSSWWT